MDRRNFIVTFSGAGAALLAPLPILAETPPVTGPQWKDCILAETSEPRFEILLEDRKGIITSLFRGKVSDFQHVGTLDLRSGDMDLQVQIEAKEAWSPGSGRAIMNIEGYGTIAEFAFNDLPLVMPGDSVTFHLELHL